MNLVKLLCCLLFICRLTPLHAQGVFSYGNHQVSKEEFLKAFLKNNNQKQFAEKDFRDYLNLYTRFKLKVQAAYDEQLDTLLSQQTELNDFRNQVIGEFLNDPSSMDMLVKEAFSRSRKDIHLAHIYIPFTSPSDTVRAGKLAAEAYNQLKKGTDFGTVAARYSADTSVRTNNGDIGWITVFTLPYQFENIVYNTPATKFSQPYRSGQGYHIFKNLGERKAVGKLKAAQILFAFPPDATETIKTGIRRKADSVYNLLLKGALFSDMVSRYSNDKTSSAAGGEMQEFGLGTYDAKFNDAVFALTQIGAITKPILTTYGYHIVKLLERIPVDPDTSNPDALALIRQQVQADPRIELSRRAARSRMFVQTGYKKAVAGQASIRMYTDSALYGKKIPGVTDSTVLFSFGKENVLAGDWIQYLQAAGGIQALNGGRTFSNMMDQFTEARLEQTYRSRLEDYNPAFAAQMKEFREGNLLFEIMQRNIWQKAAADSAELLRYYEQNKNKYWWGASAEAVLFTCKDSVTARELKSKLEKNRTGWRNIIQLYGETVQADSGRYELTQLPVPNSASRKANTLSEPVRNSPDNSAFLFVYITRMYTDRSPRNFSDAKGFVLNDYQLYLEDKWIESLKSKYPIKVNEPVFRTLWK